MLGVAVFAIILKVELILNQAYYKVHVKAQ